MTLRVLHKDGEPWFLTTDVCKVLGIVNSRHACADLDTEEKGVVTADTLGGRQKVSIISESGLYLLVLKSRKAEAQAFQKWITREVLGGITDSEGRGIPLVRPLSDSPPKVTPEGPLLVPARMVLGWQQ